MCTDAPDQTAQIKQAETSDMIAKEQLGLAREQYGDAKARQAVFDPKYMEIINASLASQKTQDARSQQLFDEYTNEVLPLRHKMFETAENYDTAGRRDQEAATARATVDTAFAGNREAQSRGLERAGVKLSAGRALTLDNANRFAASKATAGADIAARRGVEATGMSLVDNAVKTGSGLPSTGLQAAQLALGAGGAAGAGLGGQQGTFNASLSPSLSLYGGAGSASSAAGAQYGQIAGVQSAAAGQEAQGLAGLGALAATAFTVY